MSVFPYQNQFVRDLAWACFAGPLMQVEQLTDDDYSAAACGLSLTPQRLRWLQQLDSQPAGLQEWLGEQPRRLGIYFERLWHFFLEQDPLVDLVAHNLPVRDKGRTVGEFDVIYWCQERERHFHLELAVKFFLGQRGATTGELVSQCCEWLGPNSNDRLDLKLDQLLQRQIRLGDNPLARAQLQQRNIVNPGREIAINGYLFQPAHDPLPAPTGFNSQRTLCQWLHLQDLERYLGDIPAQRFLLLSKTRWLGPAQAVAEDELNSRSELPERLQSLLANGGRARLIAAIGADGTEQRRFFVTHDLWPATAQQSTLETP